MKELWSDLQRRYGSIEVIAEQVRSRVANFLSIKGTESINQLHDLLYHVRIVNRNMKLCQELGTLNFASGNESTIQKMPNFLLHRWSKTVHQHKTSHLGGHPLFSVIVEFVNTYSTPDAQLPKL